MKNAQDILRNKNSVEVIVDEKEEKMQGGYTLYTKHKGAKTQKVLLFFFAS